MKTKNVTKSTNIENEINNTFLYCKELRKGIIKKDFSSLGLETQTFENVVNAIESKGKEIIDSPMDSVLFGANLTEKQGAITKSYRLQKTIETEVITFGTAQEKNSFINKSFQNKPYFELSAVEELLVQEIDTTVVNKILASDGANNGNFGCSVDISDTKIIVRGNDNVDNSGAVYVYDLDGSNEIKLTASDSAEGDNFGYSVAVSSTKIVVGASGDDDKGHNSGAVYIYDLDGSNEIKLTASDSAADDLFGYSVAVSSTKIVVGAYRTDDNGDNSGAVYVYDLDGSNEIKLTASDSAADDYFGRNVAVSDTKIVVGASGDDDNGKNSGAVYIYDLDGSNEIKLTASDSAAYDYFGCSVDISDTKIVVGAYGDNVNGTNSGAAYVYDSDGSNEIKLTASDSAEGDNFGNSVAISSTKIVVGAMYDDDKGSASGSAYVYDLDGSNEIKLTASDGAADDYFGYSVAVSSTKIVVGASGDDDKGSASGSVYIFG